MGWSFLSSPSWSTILTFCLAFCFTAVSLVHFNNRRISDKSLLEPAPTEHFKSAHPQPLRCSKAYYLKRAKQNLYKLVITRRSYERQTWGMSLSRLSILSSEEGCVDRTCRTEAGMLAISDSASGRPEANKFGYSSAKKVRPQKYGAYKMLSLIHI